MRHSDIFLDAAPVTLSLFKYAEVVSGWHTDFAFSSTKFFEKIFIFVIYLNGNLVADKR